MAVAESWGKKKKSGRTGSRNPRIPLQNLEFDAVHFWGPVRIWPLPSYGEDSTRPFAALVSTPRHSFLVCFFLFLQCLGFTETLWGSRMESSSRSAFGWTDSGCTAKWRTCSRWRIWCSIVCRCRCAPPSTFARASSSRSGKIPESFTTSRIFSSFFRKCLVCAFSPTLTGWYRWPPMDSLCGAVSKKMIQTHGKK